MTFSRTTRISAVLAAALVVAAAISLPALAEMRGAGGMSQMGLLGGMAGGPGMMPSFDQLDADKDGKVTEAEVAAFRISMVAGADADNDGLLSVDELVAHQTRMIKAATTDHAARRVAEQDQNGDGKLSVEEMLAAPMPTAIFARLDTDGDRAVSQAEFDAAKAAFQDHGRGGGDGIGRGHGFGLRGGGDSGTGN